MKNKAQKWVFAALMDITEGFPFPTIGIDSNNGSEFIDGHLLRYCTEQKITGYHRYDTEVELALLNQIYALLRLQTNFFTPSQKLVEKNRVGAKVTKRYDTGATPYQRVLADSGNST